MRHTLGVGVGVAGAAVRVVLGVEPMDGVSVPETEGVAVGVCVSVGVTVDSAVVVPVAVRVLVRVPV